MPIEGANALILNNPIIAWNKQAIIIFEIFIVIPNENRELNGQSSVHQPLCAFFGISIYICSHR